MAAREAELATAIPVVVDVSADSLQLARRLESILAGGARALECDAAALYLLDDATEHLKLRCQWNLGVAVLAESPRPLAGAAADLEALAGHAIAIEDARRGGRWRAPRASGAALCVPVASATTLLGTLWLFSERPRTFSDHDTNLWEIIAGRLAAELEREAILRERLPHHPRPDDAMIQQALPPRTKRELKNKDWLATTRVPATEQDRTVIVDLHESDPTIQAIAIAAHDDGVAGASLASRTYAKWYQQRQGSDFLSTAHESLFRESTGDHFVSAVTVELDKHSGDVTLHAAGHIESYLIRPYAWEPWTLPTTPLGDVTATQVGRGTTTNLAANDWLLVIVGARPRTLKVHNVTLIDGKCLAETLLRLHELEIDHAADALWRLVQEHQAVWQQTPSLMLVRRFAEVHRDILEENGCRRRS